MDKYKMAETCAFDGICTQWFDAVDKDKNGELDPTELQKSLALAGLKFSLKTVVHLIRLHDGTGRGAITYPDFAKMHSFLRKAKQRFKQFDVEKNGYLTYDEVWCAFEHAGIQIDRKSAFQHMIMTFDSRRNGYLDLSEYIVLKIFMQSAACTFKAYDQGKNGKIVLNLDQFIYAAANVI